MSINTKLTMKSENDCQIYRYEHVQGNILAGNGRGRLVLLGGQKNLHLLDLDTHEDCSHLLKYNPKIFSIAQWCPAESHHFITASNQTLDLWELKTDVYQIKSSFLGHNKPICGVDWSNVNNTCIATCCNDSISHIFDTRDFKRPCALLESVLPADIVKWSKVREQILATAHDEVINIWDLRNLKTPRLMQNISAHNKKINDFDWSFNSEQIISCSRDGNVKVWDINRTADDGDNILSIRWVISHIRYMPFGNAIVTQFSAPESSSDASELYMWNMKDSYNLHQSINPFARSNNINQWFIRCSLEGYHQLIAWTHDHSLKIWTIDPMSGDPSPSNSSPDDVIREEQHHQQHKQLQQQFIPPQQHHHQQIQQQHIQQQQQKPESLLNELETLVGYPCITFEKKSSEERELQVKYASKRLCLKVVMKFPSNYPQQGLPNFDITSTNIMDASVRNKLHDELLSTSRVCVQSNRGCINQCLQTILRFVDNIMKAGETVSEVPELERMIGENVPFPRTSGARFCGPGFLVCFTRPMWMEVDSADSPNIEPTEEPTRRKNTSESSEITPRAISALAEINLKPTKPVKSNLAKSCPTDANIPSVSKYFEIKEKPAVNYRMRKCKPPHSSKDSLGPVIIYDLSCLLPVQKQLGENYVFDTNALNMCKKNAQIALSCNRRDLSQVWSLAALQVEEAEQPHNNSDRSSPWSITPFGRKLIRIWYEHYSLMKDVQTLAMLCCVFCSPKPIKTTPKITKEYDSQLSLPRKSSVFFSPTRPTNNTSKRKHSNSLSETTVINETKNNAFQQEINLYQQSQCKSEKLLDPQLQQRYNNFIRCYSNILFQWGFVNQRTELLNFLPSSDKEIQKSFVGLRRRTKHCALCNLPVYGLLIFCFECGHGGHVTHLSSWFNKHDMCPTGCGCLCITDTSNTTTL